MNDSSDPAVAAKATLDAARRAARETCIQEIAESLKRHGCRVQIVTAFVDGQPVPPQINVVDA